MRLSIFKVKGNSMHPNFTDGGYVVTFAKRKTNYKVGQVVVFNHSKFGKTIKRIQEIDINKRLKLVGDNTLESTASKKIGWQDSNDILGRVIWKISQ